MGTTTASATPVVVMHRRRVMVFEKPEVVDKTGWWAQQHTTSHDAGMTDTDDVAALLHARRHMTCLQYRRFIRDHKFMTN